MQRHELITVSRCVLRPRDTAEVSRLLRHCSARNLAVCPQVTRHTCHTVTLSRVTCHVSRVQGGNTGLVGGSVPVFDEVVISTELMTNIETVDTSSGVAVCQVGTRVMGHVSRVSRGRRAWCWSSWTRRWRGTG